MSSEGDAFRNQCRMFPALVNCCTIDWFNMWPRDALLNVSKVIINKAELAGQNKLKVRFLQFGGCNVDCDINMWCIKADMNC